MKESAVTDRRLTYEVSEKYLIRQDYPPQRVKAELGNCRSVTVVSTDRIGDTFNNLYFLSNLRRIAPKAEITFIGKKFNDPDFLPTFIGPYVNEVLFDDDVSEEKFESLRSNVIFDLNPASHLFPLFELQRTLRIGHHEVCDIIAAQRANNCKSNEHLNLLRILGYPVDFSYSLIDLAKSRPGSPAAKSEKRLYVALCFEATAKSWMLPKPVMDQLIAYLLEETEYDIHIFGSNINSNGYVYTGKSDRVTNWTCRLSLTKTIEKIADAEYVVSVDTGLMHAASYIGVPLLGIFTCGNAARNGPQGQLGRSVVLRVLVDPPTGRYEKSDTVQTGIERHFVKLEHIVMAFRQLLRSGPSSLSGRTIRAETVPFSGRLPVTAC